MLEYPLQTIRLSIESVPMNLIDLAQKDTTYSYYDLRKVAAFVMHTADRRMKYKSYVRTHNDVDSCPSKRYN